MGIVMNRFSMFKELRRNIKEGKQYGFDFNKFVLSGVVVHDPNDRDLVDYMSRNFVSWAEKTADHFLFISFIHPSDEWKKSRYCRVCYSIDQNELKVDQSIEEKDEASTMAFLRDYLELPPSGSYLVLSQDICSNKSHFVPIDAETIENQFELINGYCAEEYNGTEHTRRDFEKLLVKLEARPIQFVLKLLDILIDITSISSNCTESPWVLKEQLYHASNVLENWRNQLRKHQRYEFAEKIFHLFQIMEIFYRKCDSSKIREFQYIKEFQPIFLDDRTRALFDSHSLQLLESFNYLASIINSRRNNHDFAPYRGGYQPDMFDYSGLTIYLGKIVENECNLSIGQMMRWAMGIEMPTYYNEYCAPRGEVIVLSGDREVNINQVIRHGNHTPILKHLPIGSLLHLYQNMCDGVTEPTPTVPERLIRIERWLLNRIEIFNRSYRNPAGHIDVDSENTYHEAINAFREFKDFHMNRLFSIKQSVANPQVEVNPELQ